MSGEKRILLVAGGGTLGMHTARELLRLGYLVDVICLEDMSSDDERLTFYKANATTDYLKGLFSEHSYDGIVNFIHYVKPEDYKPYHELLIKNTEHLIFLSSYRVYADLQHPITETAPRLLDITDDGDFLQNEQYALSKARGEDFLHGECEGQNWTIVRPVISFSHRRLDLLMYSGHQVLDYAKSNKELLLPESCRNHVAGLDWAGNSGKLIANLLLKDGALRNSYTISSGQNLTWGEIAGYYTELTGLRVSWVDEETYMASDTALQKGGPLYWGYVYDRKYDRTVDNSRVLAATGLSKEDFTPIKEGLRREIAIAERG